MINALEYIAPNGARLSADKDTRKRNAWHLADIDGNGFQADAIGVEGYGLHGETFGGIRCEAREIEADVYADGFGVAGLQSMMKDVPRLACSDSEGLGVLRLMNAAGEWFRIPARLVEFKESKRRRAAALCGFVWRCPYFYFDSDTLHRVPVFAAEGGKEYISGEGLERPYTFGDIQGTADDGIHTLEVVNGGDAPAPVIVSVFGSGVTRLMMVNDTTGQSVYIQGMSVGGVEVCTDSRNLYARFNDGTDATPYIGMAQDLSAFVLKPGYNLLRVKIEATSITVAGCEVRYRDRWSACL